MRTETSWSDWTSAQFQSSPRTDRYQTFLFSGAMLAKVSCVFVFLFVARDTCAATSLSKEDSTGNESLLFPSLHNTVIYTYMLTSCRYSLTFNLWRVRIHVLSHRRRASHRYELLFYDVIWYHFPRNILSNEISNKATWRSLKSDTASWNDDEIRIIS